MFGRPNSCLESAWEAGFLQAAHLSEPIRKELESMRKKAMAGKPTEREFRESRNGMARKKDLLRVLLQRLRGVRRFAMRLSKPPSATIAGIDAAIRATEESLKVVSKIVSIGRGLAARRLTVRSA